MWWALAMVGCGSGPTVGATPAVRVPPCAPWAGYGLPPDGEEVVACDERRIAVRGEAGASDRMAAAWAETLSSRGWVRTVDNGEPGLAASRWERDGAVLHVAAVEVAGHAEVVGVRTDGG
ncbi:MAG: hypothetical protein R3F59_28775 [Myxococcota bacterium]